MNSVHISWRSMPWCVYFVQRESQIPKPPSFAAPRKVLKPRSQTVSDFASSVEVSPSWVRSGDPAPSHDDSRGFNKSIDNIVSSPSKTFSSNSGSSRLKKGGPIRQTSEPSMSWYMYVCVYVYNTEWVKLFHSLPMNYYILNIKKNCHMFHVNIIMAIYRYLKPIISKWCCSIRWCTSCLNQLPC